MKKKLLIIDRDGTIIKEPPVDFQVDSMAKLQFVPRAISSLAAISDYGYELVMATNQDGLGTDSFPEEDFWPAHNMMLDVLSSEGIVFADQLIDRSFETDNLPTRKPGIGMFGKYMSDEYDMAGSYVIGDRITDVKLAANLGAKAILMQPEQKGRQMVKDAVPDNVCELITEDWHEIAGYLRMQKRVVVKERATSETDIRLTLDLDGKVPSHINTGLGFFDHMLWQIVHHGGISLNLEVKGDLHVDEHHTVEDTAIVLGGALLEALGDKRGIERYGYVLPMDECRAMVLIDFGGRNDFEWDVQFTREVVGDVPTEMFKHFFKSFAEAAKCNLHIAAKGENEHHKIEGVFKAFARALKMAVKRDPFSYQLPSSKGIL